MARRIDTQWPIKHVIYLTMENCSFDNPFGRIRGRTGHARGAVGEATRCVPTSANGTVGIVASDDMAVTTAQSDASAETGRERPGEPPPEERPGRLRRLLSSITTRLLVSYVVLLLVATAGILVSVRQVLLYRLDEEIESQMRQEVREFRNLVRGNDPTTGQPFGDDLRAIFDVFFARNIPLESELLVAVLEDQVYLARRSAGAEYPLEQRADLIDLWSSLSVPEQGEVETPDGPARYLAVPVFFGERREGTFVVAAFPAAERAEIGDAIAIALAVSGGVLVIALLIGWRLARHVLGPVRLLARTARSITESDLTGRIAIEGNDEVSELAERFNEMLDRLEAAFRTQRDFIDDASHELRTPITVVRGHLELLEDDPEQRANTIALVTDELDRMARIVNDLLDLAKAQHPDFLDLEVVDVEALTLDVAQKAKALGRRAWRLEAGRSGRIVADRQRLTQALLQLAQNAVNHTTEGQTVRIGWDVAEGTARVWVTDEGPGIPPEDRGRIFNRFARAGRTSHDGSAGAGLGLPIVRAIAEAHHGRVGLQSAPGEGATFTLILPVDQPIPAADAGAP
jgi:signal transduction histidine kinase